MVKVNMRRPGDDLYEELRRHIMRYGSSDTRALMNVADQQHRAEKARPWVLALSLALVLSLIILIIIVAGGHPLAVVGHLGAMVTVSSTPGRAG